MHLPLFRTTLVFISLCLCALSPAHAETQRPTAKETAATYGADPAREKLALSPSGGRIAYEAERDGERYLLVQSLEDGEVLTGAALGEIRLEGVGFLTDEKLILRGAEDDKQFRGARHQWTVATAYVLDVASGEIQQLLTPGHRIDTFQPYGLGTISGVSPDRKTLYMPAKVRRDPYERTPPLALMAVNVDNPRDPEVVNTGHRHATNYFLDEEGELLAQERLDFESQQHRIMVPTEGGGWRTLFERDNSEETGYFAGLTSDGQSLVLVRHLVDSGQQPYFQTLSLETGELSELDTKRDDIDAEGLVLDSTRKVRGVSYAGFQPRYHLFDAELNERLKTLQSKFKGHSVALVGSSDKQRELLLHVQGPSTSGDYYLVNKDDSLAFITPTYPKLGEERVHPMMAFRYEARDGLSIPALLTLPKDKAGKPQNLPTVLMPHGGPHVYDRLGFDFMAQALAARGYAVVQPQFRGSTGFGRAHWEAGQGEWGRAMQDDLTDAVGYLAEAGLTDPERVCIVGASYGGYAAMAGAAFTPELYRCAVSLMGVTDLVTMMDHDEEKFEESDWVYDYLTRSVAADYFTEERIAAHSPARFASSVQAPVLLIHGEDDKRVPLQQSELMHEKLKEAGKEVELVPIEGMGHSYYPEEKRIETLEALLPFVDKHMKREAP